MPETRRAADCLTLPRPVARSVPEERAAPPGRRAPRQAALLAAGVAVFGPLWARAAVEQPAPAVGGGTIYDNDFGYAVAQSGSTSLVGANSAQQNIGGYHYRGAAYVFRNVDADAGTVTQDATLVASSGSNAIGFGNAISSNGSTGLFGASQTYVGGVEDQGVAFVFRNLDTATGTVTQNAELMASDGGADDTFGSAVILSGNTGLIAAVGATVGGNASQGAAYLFRNLDTATGTVNENVKLIASDGTSNAYFGSAVGLDGSTGLIGAYGATVGGNASQGAAYVFHNLGAATGTVTQSAKLVASDGAANDDFGIAVSLSGTVGLVGAFNGNVRSDGYPAGAAYLFRNLDTASGTVTQNVKLTAAASNANVLEFGYAVSLSGHTGLVGAYGAAFVFLNLNSAGSSVTEDVKLTSSSGATNFGDAVAVDGDHFTVGAGTTAVSGTITSMTTLDVGNASRTIGGISFVSQDHWIIGQTTSGNAVTLSKGGTANVTAAGRGIYIGQSAGSDNNTLLVQGKVIATTITVSATSGGSGNTLQIDNNGGTTAGNVSASNGIILNPGGELLLSGLSEEPGPFSNATPVVLAGGTFNLGGLSAGADGQGGLGNLSTTASSTLDFGTPGTVNVVRFGGLGSHVVGQVLHVTDWEGTPNVPGETDRLYFTGVATAFTLAYPQADVTFDGLPGYDVEQDGSYYEVYAAPEPTSLMLAAVGVAPLLGRRRARL